MNFRSSKKINKTLILLVLFAFIISVPLHSTNGNTIHQSKSITTRLLKDSQLNQNETINDTAFLSSNLICNNLTIISGVTLYTEGYSIICNGSFVNNGTIVTGYSTPQDLPYSYGGSGGGAQSQSENAGLSVGFSTIYPGGAGSSSNSIDGYPGVSSELTSNQLNNAIIFNWFQNNMSNFITGAEGESTGYVSAGSGAYGLYLQANYIDPGYINSFGGSGNGRGSGVGLSGGGGGGVVLLAYGSGGIGGISNIDVSGGNSATSLSGAISSGVGGNGTVITYNYGSTPPVKVASSEGLVTVIENGLPSMMSWSVTISNETYTSYFNELNFPATLGLHTLTFTYNGGNNQSSESVSVNSSADLVISHPFSYYETGVSFNANGLPFGVNWTVLSNGHSGSSVSGNSIYLNLPAGNDSFIAYYNLNGSYYFATTSNLYVVNDSYNNIFLNFSKYPYSPDSVQSQYGSNAAHSGFYNFPGPYTPNLLWKSQVESYSGESLLAASNNIFLSVFNQEYGYIYGINSSSGAKKFTGYTAHTNSGDPTSLASYYSASGSGNVFFYDYCIGCFLTDGPWLVADNATTGQNVWQVSVPELGAYSSTLGYGTLCFYNNTLFFVYTNTPYIYAYNASNGNLEWNATALGNIDTVPVVDNNTLLLGFSNIPMVEAFSTRLGNMNWNLTLDNETGATPSAYGGSFYIPTRNGTLYRVSINGTIVWSKNFHTKFNTSPSEGYGKVYLTTQTGNLFSLSQSTGNLIWSFKLNNGSSVPTELSSNSIVYAASNTTLYALNSIKGSILWNYHISSGIYSEPLLYNGDLYVVSGNGTIYSFGINTDLSIPDILLVKHTYDYNMTGDLESYMDTFAVNFGSATLTYGNLPSIESLSSGNFTVTLITVSGSDLSLTQKDISFLWQIQISVLGKNVPPNWYLRLNDVNYTFTAPVGYINLSNGVYKYTIVLPSGYATLSSESGMISVNGTQVLINGASSQSIIISVFKGSTSPLDITHPHTWEQYLVIFLIILGAVLLIATAVVVHRRSSYSNSNNKSGSAQVIMPPPPPASPSPEQPPESVVQQVSPQHSPSAVGSQVEYEKGTSSYAIVGYTGGGKTTFITLFVYAAGFIDEISQFSFTLESVSEVLRNAIKSLLSGEWPSGTLETELRTQTSITLSKKSGLRTKKVNLRINDAAGETWRRLAEEGETPQALRNLISTMPQVSYLAWTSGYIIMVDCDRYSEWITEQFNYLNILKAIYYLNGKKKVSKPVAIIFTKFDAMPDNMQNTPLDTILKTDLPHMYQYLHTHFSMKNFQIFKVGLRVRKPSDSDKPVPSVILIDGRKSLDIIGGGRYGQFPDIIRWMLKDA